MLTPRKLPVSPNKLKIVEAVLHEYGEKLPKSWTTQCNTGKKFHRKLSVWKEYPQILWKMMQKFYSGADQNSKTLFFWKTSVKADIPR